MNKDTQFKSQMPEQGHIVSTSVTQTKKHITNLRNPEKYIDSITKLKKHIEHSQLPE